MSLYPDNKNRANRVQQLCTDIAHIQTQIKQNVEDARKQDERALVLLNKIATRAGFKTLDEYIDKAAEQLPADEKAAFEDMKREVEKLGADMDLSHKVFRGLIACGLVTGGIRIFALAFKETQSLLFGMQAVVRSIYYSILGAAETAAKLMSFGRVTLNLVSKAGGITAEAMNGMKYLKIGGGVMVGVGVVVDAALLIAEAIQGAEQRAKLQKAIKELCAHRFIVKEMEQQAREILTYKSDAKSIIQNKDRNDQKVANHKMTPEEAAEEMEEDCKTLEDQMKEGMNKITPNTIWQMLVDQDKLSSIAWTDEDPGLLAILKWIEEHPQRE